MVTLGASAYTRVYTVIFQSGRDKSIDRGAYSSQLLYIYVKQPKKEQNVCCNCLKSIKCCSRFSWSLVLIYPTLPSPQADNATLQLLLLCSSTAREGTLTGGVLQSGLPGGKPYLKKK